ncbi:hypothetical protein LCGC14_3165960, partial [marine sediment metagenome]
MAVGLITGGNDAKPDIHSHGERHHRSIDTRLQSRSVSTSLGVVPVSSLRLVRQALSGEDLDESPPTLVPSQGHPQVAATGDASHRQADAGRMVGEVVEGDVALGGALSYTDFGAIVAAYSWPINEAFQVVDCESSWDAGAVSWAGSRGLMQLMPVHAWRFAARGW